MPRSMVSMVMQLCIQHRPTLEKYYMQSPLVEVYKLHVDILMQVGLLDIDICGPSMPKMLGLEGHEVHQSASGWSPVYVEDNLGVMSIGERRTAHISTSYTWHDAVSMLMLLQRQCVSLCKVGIGRHVDSWPCRTPVQCSHMC